MAGRRRDPAEQHRQTNRGRARTAPSLHGQLVCIPNTPSAVRPSSAAVSMWFDIARGYVALHDVVVVGRNQKSVPRRGV